MQRHRTPLRQRVLPLHRRTIGGLSTYQGAPQNQAQRTERSKRNPFYEARKGYPHRQPRRNNAQSRTRKRPRILPSAPQTPRRTLVILPNHSTQWLPHRGHFHLG